MPEDPTVSQKYASDNVIQEDSGEPAPVVAFMDTTDVQSEEHKKDPKSASKSAWAHSRRETDMYAPYAHDGFDLDDEIPIGFVESKMKHYVRDGKLRTELFIFVPFLVLFLVFSLTDIDIEQGHMALGALRETFAKKYIPNSFKQRDMILPQVLAGQPVQNDRVDMTFADIESAEHWFDWFNTMLGDVWQCGDTKNGTSTAPNVINGTVLPKPFKSLLIPIGAMRITTKLVTNTSCSIPSDVLVDQNQFESRYNLTDQRCWASHKNSREVQTPTRCAHKNFANPFNNGELYRYQSCSNMSGVVTTTDQGIYDCSGYVIEIPFTAACDQIFTLADIMADSDCPFVDDVATRFVTVEAFFYSVPLDVHYSVKMIAELTSGGSWLPTTQFRGMIVFSDKRIWKVVLEFFFLTYVFYYMAVFFINLRTFYQEEGLFLRYFASFWTILEMVNVVCYLAVFILRWMWWAESNKIQTNFPFAPKYPDLDDTLYLYSQMRYALAFNFILTFLKTLKFLKMSNKLNVIALTFEKSQTDVFGLLFLFVMVVTGYALAGTSLFGPLMREFSSLDRSFSSLMQMILGVMDYEAMKNTQRGIAGLYFWSYLVISFFLILNFIVAVISEAFTQAGEAEFSPPLAEGMLMIVDEFIYTLHPRSIKNRIFLLKEGRKSTNFLHNQILTYVAQLNTTKQMENPTALQNPVTPREIIRFLPSNLRREYAPFFAHEWKVISHEYELLSESDQEQVAQARRLAIQNGMKKGMQNKDLGRILDPALERADKILEIGDQVCHKLADKFDLNLKQSFMRPGTREGRPQSGTRRRASFTSPMREGTLLATSVDI